MVSLSLDDVPEASWETARIGTEQVFAALDRRFSLYRADSELSLVNRGEIPLTEASSELREVYEQASEWRLVTSGAFNSERSDGLLDLDGIVKAIAVERAGELLTAAGLGNWCLNAGGDVLVAGRAEGGREWLLGVADPADRSALLTTITVAEPWRAVATSGTSERGDHLWYRSPVERHFSQVTVVAGDIVTADVLATAIIAADVSQLDSLAGSRAAEVLAVHDDGSIVATRHLREQLLRPQ